MDPILVDLEAAENHLKLTNDIFAVFSISSAVTVLVILSFISLYDSKLVNRVSLKLCSAIAVVDIFRTISFTFYIYIKEEGLFCKINGGFINFIILCHMLLSVGIALNLQLLFLNRKIYKDWWQWFYWFLGFGVPAILTLIVGALGSFGLDPVSGVCFFKTIHTTDVLPHVYLWIGFMFPTIFGCTYCLSVAVLTILSLKDSKSLLFRLKMKSNSRSNPDKLNSSTSEDDGVNAKSTKLTINEDTLSLLIRRITIYCVIPTVTQFGCTLAIFYGEVHGEIPFWMYYLDVVATHLSGILSLVGFLYDPALKNSLNFIKLDLLNYKVNSASYDNEFNFNTHHHPWICVIFRKILLRSSNNTSNTLSYSNNTPIQNIIVDVKEITDNEKFPNNDNNINMKDLSQRSQHTIDSYDTNNTGANLVKADSNDTNKNSKAKRKDKSYFRAVAGL